MLCRYQIPNPLADWSMVSSRVGLIGPWPTMKAFMASDQKKEADISIGADDC